MLELARESDFEEFSRLDAQGHALHVTWRPDIYCPCEGAFPKDYFLECIHQRRVFMAKVQGTVVGYVLFRIWQTGGSGNVPRKILDLDSIVVDQAARGQGFGTQMMAELRVLAKAFGCTDLQLSVYPQNDAAVDFYQKCGFTIRNINMQRKV